VPRRAGQAGSPPVPVRGSTSHRIVGSVSIFDVTSARPVATTERRPARPFGFRGSGPRRRCRLRDASGRPSRSASIQRARPVRPRPDHDEPKAITVLEGPQQHVSTRGLPVPWADIRHVIRTVNDLWPAGSVPSRYWWNRAPQCGCSKLDDPQVLARDSRRAQEWTGKCTCESAPTTILPIASRRRCPLLSAQVLALPRLDQTTVLHERSHIRTRALSPRRPRRGAAAPERDVAVRVAALAKSGGSSESVMPSSRGFWAEVSGGRAADREKLPDANGNGPGTRTCRPSHRLRT